jgi:hypothetical protein
MILTLTSDDLEYFAELQGIEDLVPSGEALSLMAELNPPPQSWFDEGEPPQSHADPDA